MNNMLDRDMLEATRLTKAGRLGEATALLQRLLGGGRAPAAKARAESPTGREASTVWGNGERMNQRPSPAGPTHARDIGAQGFGPAQAGFGKGVSGGLHGLFERIGAEIKLPGLGRPQPVPAPDIVPDGGQFLSRTYGNAAGTLAYKLYIPSGHEGQALPLLVMLHGCKQSPDDFAAGTRMNRIAEEHRCLVAYPEQSAAANISKCWNWFRPADQQRGQGEPALIAGITRQVMDDYRADPSRVYIAGLSAGAAAAAIMGATYPDLYAAIGVHSGLACGAASDLPSAFAAMREGERALRPRLPAGDGEGRIVPTIVFHGDRDATVHPENGDRVIAQWTTATKLHPTVERGEAAGGHSYTRTLHADADGQVLLEHWDIHGAGHAWSGGSPAGTFTDARGPDASREMIRFFLAHPRPAALGTGPK
jgi:poly(hydroxyalkanoate) depolymerase family esterase